MENGRRRVKVVVKAKVAIETSPEQVRDNARLYGNGGPVDLPLTLGQPSGLPTGSTG